MTKMIIKDKAYAVDLLKQRVRHIQDELTDTERALDSLTDRKKFMNQAKKDEVLDTLRYLYNDYYEYPKDRMWSDYSEIWDIDFAQLREFLEKNGVDL